MPRRARLRADGRGGDAGAGAQQEARGFRGAGDGVAARGEDLVRRRGAEGHGGVRLEHQDRAIGSEREIDAGIVQREGADDVAEGGAGAWAEGGGHVFQEGTFGLRMGGQRRFGAEAVHLPVAGMDEVEGEDFSADGHDPVFAEVAVRPGRAEKAEGEEIVAREGGGGGGGVAGIDADEVLAGVEAGGAQQVGGGPGQGRERFAGERRDFRRDDAGDGAQGGGDGGAAGAEDAVRVVEDRGLAAGDDLDGAAQLRRAEIRVGDGVDQDGVGRQGAGGIRVVHMHGGDGEDRIVDQRGGDDIRVLDRDQEQERNAGAGAAIGEGDAGVIDEAGAEGGVRGLWIAEGEEGAAEAAQGWLVGGVEREGGEEAGAGGREIPFREEESSEIGLQGGAGRGHGAGAGEGGARGGAKPAAPGGDGQRAEGGRVLLVVRDGGEEGGEVWGQGGGLWSGVGAKVWEAGLRMG
jgi:hypothetical protein